MAPLAQRVIANAEAALAQALIARFGTLGRVPAPFLLRSEGVVFTCRSYTALARGYGLRQEFITPHSPEQNGVVKRVIRTLGHYTDACRESVSGAAKAPDQCREPSVHLRGSSGRLCSARPGDTPLRLFDPRRTFVSTKNRQIKRELFLSAFAALRDPMSRAYYTRKISQDNVTTKPSLRSLVAAAMSCSRCSEMRPFTARRAHKIL